METFIDNFLRQYRNEVHASTSERPALLFKFRLIRCSMRCPDFSDLTYFRGNELRQARGIIVRQLGCSRVETTDLNDATVHRRHLNQIHFRESSMPNVDLDDSHMDNENSDYLFTDNTVG